MQATSTLERNGHKFMLRLKLNRRPVNYIKGRAEQRSRLRKEAQLVYRLQN